MFNETIKQMKKRNLFMSATLMCGLFTIAFKFDGNGVHWFWTDYKPVVFILAIAAITFGVLWIRAARRIKTEV